MQQPDERFRLLVENVSDYAIFMLDPEGRVASWNRGAERLKQYKEEEITGQHFSRFYPAEDIAARKPEIELERALADGRVEDEGWRIRKDGSRFWALVVITALYDAAGTFVGFAKVTRDLTERRRAEEHLRASEEQFRLLVERVEEYAIYMLDANGYVATWNSGAEKIKGYDAHEIIGKHFGCFYTPEDIAAGRPRQNLENAAQLGHIRDQGIRVRKDGSAFQADVVITALRNANGQLRGFSKVTRDVSDQVRAREAEAEKIAAQKASQAKDEFLATLSHELRTPLTPALAAVSFMAENAAELPARFSDDIALIRRNVQLEARLIDDLLDLTRISTGKVELRLQRANAHAIARDALNVAKSDIHRKGLRVQTHWAAQDCYVWADPIRLEQIFWNLINNAVKFTPAGGEISLRTSDDGGRFHFAITDTGVGIAPERQSTLFDAFEQGDSQTARQFGGLGLGLAICKNLVDLHGGTIAISSGGLGCGTTATVSFECFLEGPGRAATAEPTAKAAKARLRILLVEDHEDTRRILARLLTHFGHEVATAAGVEDALATFRSGEFDLVLSDIGLPDGTGYDVITQV
ncbi:MAG: PAS domain S-box protein, partial [Verrucomicrobiota bacterium]|nr:PAS domain S-box protein [Verrucomicrobiota bacterium]